MRVRILVGKRAGEETHVPRNQKTFSDIELGFIEPLDPAEIAHPSANPNDHIHAIPPPPPLQAEFALVKLPISETYAIRARLPRGDTTFYNSVPEGKPWQVFLNWIAPAQVPDDVLESYRYFRGLPRVDPEVQAERQRLERIRLENEQSNQNAHAAVYLGRATVRR